MLKETSKYPCLIAGVLFSIKVTKLSETKLGMLMLSPLDLVILSIFWSNKITRIGDICTNTKFRIRIIFSVKDQPTHSVKWLEFYPCNGKQLRHNTLVGSIGGLLSTDIQTNPLDNRQRLLLTYHRLLWKGMMSMMCQ